MDKHLYRLTPIGYAVVRKEDDVEGGIDTDIEHWFNLYNRFMSGANLKELRLAVLTRAFDYFAPFNGFENWVMFNLKETTLTQLQARFLTDTLKYIRTGYRDIDIGGWEYLLRSDAETQSRTASPSTVKLKSTKEDYSKLALPYRYNGKNANGVYDKSLAEWVTHPYGFQDMIWTLKILFSTKLD